ncbi:hypothetical protein CRUP_028777, partial [Coryphaenoides rupestris]
MKYFMKYLPTLPPPPPPAGSPVTPNYVDNSTSSVAPWCSCAAAGNQREECGEFLSFFTHNTCL